MMCWSANRSRSTSDQNVLELRMTPHKRAESGSGDGSRLGRLERRDGDKALHPAPERELAEGLARTPYCEHRGLPDRRKHAEGESPPRDQMNRVGYVAVMEDHFVALERTPSRQREEPADIRRRHALEDAELHLRRVASRRLCNRRGRGISAQATLEHPSAIPKRKPAGEPIEPSSHGELIPERCAAETATCQPRCIRRRRKAA